MDRSFDRNRTENGKRRTENGERRPRIGERRTESGERRTAEGRRSEGQLVYGLRPVIEALASGRQIERVMIQNGLNSSLLGELRTRLAERGVPAQYVPVEKLDRLTTGNHQGVVATVAAVPYRSLTEILESLSGEVTEFSSREVTELLSGEVDKSLSGEVDKSLSEGSQPLSHLVTQPLKSTPPLSHLNPLIVLLDHVTDVRNMGAIARTAECTGAAAMVVPDRGSAAMNEDAIKTSSGALLRLPVCREQNMKTVVNLVKQYGYQVVAATEKGAVHYREVDFRRPTLLILGNEETGISPDLLRMSDVRARLPIVGEVASLNVSVAAGVFLYEALEQRTH